MRIREKQHSTGQSLWLGHVSRELINNPRFAQHMEEYGVSGMSLTPQAFLEALIGGDAYDNSIGKKLAVGFTGEPLVYQLIYEDVRYAADLLRPVYDRSDGVDGWVVFPVSPFSTSNNDTLTEELGEFHAQICRPNVLLCLPALPNRGDVIEELVYSGVPIIISNIYSAQQYVKIFDACLTGIGRRIDSGQKSQVSTFISIDVSRLGSDYAYKLDLQAAGRLSVTLACKIYRTMIELYGSSEWMRVNSAGVRPFRMIWSINDNRYLSVEGRDLYAQLIEPLTILELPQQAIYTLINHPVPEKQAYDDGRNCDQVLDEFERTGFDVEVEATRLQRDHFEWMLKEWAVLLESTARKAASLISVEASN